MGCNLSGPSLHPYVVFLTHPFVNTQMCRIHTTSATLSAVPPRIQTILRYRCTAAELGVLFGAGTYVSLSANDPVLLVLHWKVSKSNGVLQPGLHANTC
jgi:hypothetical protein